MKLLDNERLTLTC